MKHMNLRIKCNGTPKSTEVFVGETKLKSVQSVEIHPIRNRELVKATITAFVEEIDIVEVVGIVAEYIDD